MTDLETFYATFSDKRVFLLGAGISHRDLIRPLIRGGASVTLCDKRSQEELSEYLLGLEDLPLETRLGKEYLSHLTEADVIFRTPGIDYTRPEIQEALSRGIAVTSEMECFFSLCPATTIGITGSDGKTTTSTLIARALAEMGYHVHLGGNIGRPLLPLIDKIADEDIAVVELSSFQLISMRESPDIAVVTNVTPNHLDHHRDMAEYIGAKQNILRRQTENGIAVLNRDNEVTVSMESDVRGSLLWFSRRQAVESGAFWEQDELFFAAQGSLRRVMHKQDLQLLGEHNLENVAAAYAAVSSLVGVKAFSKAASSFTGVEHRLERVRTKDGVLWVNDSIATTPTRTLAGLASFDRPLLLIAGGSDKELDYTAFADNLPHSLRLMLLSGPTAEKIEQAVRNSGGNKPKIIRTDSVAESVKQADKLALKGDVVLLSPASPSFDCYQNFEERGKHFKKLVKDL